MKLNNLFGKLHKLEACHDGGLGLLLSPKIAEMPAPIQKFDEPFLPFGKMVVDATQDLICAYVFDFAAYLALGAAGAIALERTIAYVGDSALTVLHARFAGAGYIATAEAFGVDSVTLADETYSDAYRSAGLGVFEVDSPRLFGEGVEMRLLGEDVLYASQREDFAVRLREAVQAVRNR